MEKFIGPGIVIIIFVVIVNVYHILKNKKRNAQSTNAVNAFQANYRKDTTKTTQKQTDEYIQYITKYNSSVDFIDKNEFIEDAAKSKIKEENRRINARDLHNKFM